MTMTRKRVMKSKKSKSTKSKLSVGKKTENTIKKVKEVSKENVASTSIAGLSLAPILDPPIITNAIGAVTSTHVLTATSSKVISNEKKGKEDGKVVLNEKKGKDNGSHISNFQKDKESKDQVNEKKDTKSKEQVNESRRKDQKSEKQIFKGKNKIKESDKQIVGFIFMCSAKTKSECYHHRVFGLPIGKKDVVDKIKFGAKLFLFDFDLKLLYGIYKATSNGRLNLERNAFRGNFPAQVRFKVHEDCLPLPESSFRHAIRDNYVGRSKFRQELTSKQVRDLTSLCRPVTVHSHASRPPRPLRSPTPVVQEVYELPARASPEDSYLSGMRYTHHLPAIGSQQGHILPHAQYDRYEIGHSSGEPQHVIQEATLPRYPDSYYLTGSRREYTPEGVLFSAHDPYRRYGGADAVSRERVVLGYDRDYTSQLPLGYALPPGFAQRELALSNHTYYPPQNHAYAHPPRGLSETHVPRHSRRRR